MKQLLAFSIIMAVFLSACTNTGKLTRRYKSVEYSTTQEMTNMVTVSAFINDKEKEEPPKPRVIIDALAPQGQKAYLTALAAKESATDKYLASITSTFAAKENATELLDYTKIEKRINLSVENIKPQFGNRVVKLRVRIKFDPQVIRLKGCDKLVTQYQTVELGKLNYSNTSGFEGNANVGAGYGAVIGTTGSNTGKGTVADERSGEGYKTSTGTEDTWTGGNSNTLTSTGSVGASAKYTGSRSFAEEVMLRQRIVAITASINNNTLSLYQESISGIDLTGTVFADVVLGSDEKNIAVQRAFSFTDLYAKDGSALTPDKVKVRETRIRYHNLTGDITAELSYDADYREITKGASTISESDDRIKLQSGSVPARTITLLKAEHLRPKMWILAASVVPKLPVSIQGTYGSGDLIFTSYSDALSFLRWLRKQTFMADGSIKVSDYTLTLPNGLKDPKDIEVAVN